MGYSRWYDKYVNLKNLLALLQKVDDYSVELISQDFIQIILQKYNSKFDEFIQYLSENPTPRYTRWYDRNYNLHTCLEFIKVLEDSEKEEIINSFIMSLFGFFAENNFGIEGDEEYQND